MIHFSDLQIVLQEVPGEISLCISATGCPLRCQGCHSPFLWKKGSGTPLTDERFISEIERYRGMITCVLFMGGEWDMDDLLHKLQIARTYSLHTCLYTGLEENQVFMFDVFCRFKILGNELLESGSKPIFSAYASKSVKFHVAREERVQDLLNGNYFEILQGSEKEKYFQNEFVTHEVEIEENEELVIAGLGWINVKRGPLKVQLEVPKNVKVIVRPSIFKNRK